jgi:hypothetical protein
MEIEKEKQQQQKYKKCLGFRFSTRKAVLCFVMLLYIKYLLLTN